jgi:hypothetical protein
MIVKMKMGWAPQQQTQYKLFYNSAKIITKCRKWVKQVTQSFQWAAQCGYKRKMGIKKGDPI